MGPIWDPSGQPAYGLTHMGPMPNPVALPIWDPYRHVCWVALLLLPFGCLVTVNVL